MWGTIWYLGFPMFAVSVFGAPYKKNELGNDSQYNADQFDVVYDQRQKGTENYKFNVDGLSLVWSSNSLLAAAALLEPALYGEYPETNIDIILGPEGSKPEEKPAAKPESEPEKPSGEKPEKEKPLENSTAPTILVIDGNQLSGQNVGSSEPTVAGSKRKLRLPGLFRPFLRKRSSVPSSNSHSTTIS